MNLLNDPTGLRMAAALQLSNAVALSQEPNARAGEVADAATLSIALMTRAAYLDACDARVAEAKAKEDEKAGLCLATHPGLTPTVTCVRVAGHDNFHASNVTDGVGNSIRWSGPLVPTSDDEQIAAWETLGFDVDGGGSPSTYLRQMLQEWGVVDTDRMTAREMMDNLIRVARERRSSE
jgi:hypothetical protein